MNGGWIVVERSKYREGEGVYRGSLGAYEGRMREIVFHVPPAPYIPTWTRNILYTENAFDFIFFRN